MSTSSAKPIEIRLLGEFRVCINGEDRTSLMTYCKPKLLLALLALGHDKSYSRAALAELIWPDCVADARANLRHALCVLRHLLAPAGQALICKSRSVALDPQLVHVDVLALAGAPGYGDLTVEQRLAYDQGELLEQLVSTDPAPLRAWKMGWQSRLAQEISRCREQHLASVCESGDTDAALAAARDWVQQHPGDESAHRHLIRLLRDNGRREAASRAYEHCAAVMGEYYGVSPNEETQALLSSAPMPWDIPGHTTLDSQDWRPLAILAIALARSDALPPDRAMDVLGRLRDRLTWLAQGSGGSVYAGADGSLTVMFGYPEVCMTPADTAARLACTIQRFAMPTGIAVGMGLHADLSCVSSASVAGAAMLIGQRALRLAYLAEPGEVLMTDEAQSRLGDRFKMGQDDRYGLSVCVLQGREDPTSVHRMFGRSQEFELLARRWTELDAPSSPTTIVLQGAHGVGKSLMLRAFAQYAQHAGGLVRSLRCDQANRNATLHPLREYLVRNAANADSATPASILQADESYLNALNGLARQAGLRDTDAGAVASYLLRTHASGTRGGLGMAASEDLNLAIVQALLTHTPTPQQPLLLVLDDVQWADPETLALLRRVMQQTQPRRCLLLLGASENFSGLPGAETLVLPPLPRPAMMEMVSYQTRDRRFPSVIRRRIVDSAEGIPLHAEEMVRTGVTHPDFEAADATPLMRDLRACGISPGRRENPVFRSSNYAAPARHTATAAGSGQG